MILREYLHMAWHRMYVYIPGCNVSAQCIGRHDINLHTTCESFKDEPGETWVHSSTELMNEG